MEVSKRLKESWKDSIKHVITTYIQFIPSDEIGEAELETFEFVNDKDVHVSTFPKTKTLKERIPCLCIGYKEIMFQVLFDVKFSTICDGNVFDITLVNFSIPNKYAHGLTDTEINKLYPVMGDIVLELNDEFKNRVVEYGDIFDEDF